MVIVMLRVEEIFDATTIGFGLAVIVLFIIVAWLKGFGESVEGVSNGLNMFIKYMFLILFAMLLASLVQILVPKEIISRYLGESSGWKGVLIGSFVGAILPGSPYAVIPLLASFMKMGAGVSTIIAMLASWGLVSITRLIFQASVMGFKFTVIYVLSVIILPLLAGFIAIIIENLLR